jgi:uncharacterized protein
MLLKFSVANYKSFKESQELDLTATADKTHIAENTFPVKNHRLLKSVAIYGPNASGKTNLLVAVGFMRSFVLNSTNNQSGEEIRTNVFKLDSHTINKPSMFEIEFFVENIRYRYGFAVNKTRVTREWLYVFQAARSQCWFDRAFNAKKKEYEWKFGSKFKGRIQSWKEQTLENTLFLSRASQLNSEQLQPVFLWFKNLFVLNASKPIHPNFTFDWCLGSEKHKNEVLNFLKIAGANIVDIEFEETEISYDELPAHVKNFLENNKSKNKIHKPTRRKINMVHKMPGKDKTTTLSYREESAGTRKLFDLAGVWLKAIEEGRTLIVDELNSSLHPILAKFLIQCFQDKEINSNGAQLIFTGHDTFLLDTEIFRRDQIWFTEIGSNGGTELFSLAEFNARKSEAIGKGYLKGRYGAVPNVDKTLLS